MPETVRALHTLIPQLRDRGYAFVTVCDLLGLPAFKD
jgi:peptidoglycan/xylan/chitin deacetylase (PgdA/CDA1 family)